MRSPEEQCVIIIGAGLAGVWCALEVKRAHPDWRVRLAEREAEPMPGFRRMALMKLLPPVDDAASLAHERVYRGSAFARQLFFRFGEEAFVHGLAEGPVDSAAPLQLRPLETAKKLTAELEAAGVEFSPARKATEVAKDGDGRFRVWFNVGNPWEGDALVLATGGARNRAFWWAEAWGHRVRRGSPAFLGLRLSENRWRAARDIRMENITVHWQDPDGGQRFQASGNLSWRYPFLEGSAIAALTAQAIDPLRALQAKGKLEIALPSVKERGLDHPALQRHVQEGGSRKVVEDVRGGLDPAFWQAVTRGARIGANDTWSRLSRKQLQTLVSHLSRLTVKFAGYRQWREEFSIQGGLEPDQFDPTTMQSRCLDGLYAVGEILDIDGAPGGTNLHLAMASAAVAADGIVAQLGA